MATSCTYNRARTKQCISDSVSPVITVDSVAKLNDHLKADFGINNFYEYLSLLGNFQTNASSIAEDVNNNSSLIPHGPFNLRFAPDMSTLLDIPMDLPNIIQNRIEKHLQEENKDLDRGYEQESGDLFQVFFEKIIDSLDLSFPLTMCNHPVACILGLDLTITDGYNLDHIYEEARELLVKFKNIKRIKKNEITNDWRYININDVLPVFVLCYNDNDQHSFENACSLAKQLKKQLFVESILLPIWHKGNDGKELKSEAVATLQTLLYDMKINLIQPFMQRKIQFWTENILNHRKSISKLFFKKFSRQSSPATGSGSNSSAELAEEEFLLRKLADWSFMMKDYKTAFTVYEQLVKDFNGDILKQILPLNFDPRWILSSALFWSSISIFMGAQTILTGKMIKSEIDPLINRAMSELIATSKVEDGKYEIDQIFILILKFLVPLSELFLTLSDEWLGVPFAIRWYEEILYWSNEKYSIIECFIWERLSYCFKLRVDPRVTHHTKISHSSHLVKNIKEDKVSINPNKLDWGQKYIMNGHQRERKALFFELLAAKKWLECGQKSQARRLIDDLDKKYKILPFAERHELLLYKLKEDIKNMQ